MAGSTRRAVLAFAGAALVAGLSGWSSTLHAKAKWRVHTVLIEGMKFVPAQIEAAPGDTIVWTNVDVVPHTATHVKGAFDSKTIHAKKSWRHQVTSPGTFSYVCTFHSGMQGTIIVK